MSDLLHTAPLTRKSSLYYLTGGAALCVCFTLLGMHGWLTQEFFRPAKPGHTRSLGYTNWGLASLIVAVTFGVASVVLLVETALYCVRYAFHLSQSSPEWTVLQRAAIVAQALLAAVFFVLGITLLAQWAGDPAKCAFLLCIGSEKHPFTHQAQGDSFKIVFAVMMVVLLVPPAVVLWYRSYTLWLLQGTINAPELFPLRRRSTVDAGSDESGCIVVPTEKPRSVWASWIPFSATSPRVCNPSILMARPRMQLYRRPITWSHRLPRVLCVCAAILFCAVITFWLPNDPRKLCANCIASFASLIISTHQRTANTAVPELPNAIFRTGQVHISPDLTLKLFPGNVFFYVYLLTTTVIVFVLRHSRRGRYWMQCRIPPCVCFTYGEAAFVASTGLLVFLFLVYWLHDHNYKQSWSLRKPDMAVGAWERWGRGLGQLAILFLSLLLLPVGRQSIVGSVLGVSRDALLWFHRAVGYAMLAATVGHILTFYVSYAEYGKLWHNLNRIPTIVGKKGVFDDYTVMAATWTTWFLLVAMGIFALDVVRRQYYEIFYYTHLAATYMTLPMMILHASAGWMYMMPGVTVFLLDQWVRLWQRSAAVRVVEARVVSQDTIEIRFAVLGRWDMLQVYPGQHVFICIPEISALQWHPFTLTNVVNGAAGVCGAEAAGGAETETVFSVHVKSVGLLTWTGRLYDCVRSGQVFSLCVEGPCGTPVDYSHYDDVLLIGGGIGVAACVSVYGSLLRESRKHSGSTPRVRLLWSTRSAALVGAMADHLLLPAAYCMMSTKWSMEDGEGFTGDHITAVHQVVELAAAPQFDANIFGCDIYITRSGEFEKFPSVSREDGSANTLDHARKGRPRVMTREEEERNASVSDDMRANRGARVHLHQGRPDVKREIGAMLADPATGRTTGDVKDKLVVVCGPASLVEDVVKAAAYFGVAVHTNEFSY